MNIQSKIGLGTAQFGFNYGIANPQGQVPEAEVSMILETAQQFQIDTIDTAIAYGESEAILGRHDLTNFDIITKLPQIPADITDIRKWARESIQMSLHRLNIKKLSGVLLHRPEDLLTKKGDKLFYTLIELKESKLIQKIGLSIYDPFDLDRLCEKYKFDLIQAPLNVFDQRLVTTGWLQKLHDMHITVHVRSVFLQGLLLIPSAKRHKYFHKWIDQFDIWDNFIVENRLSALALCLNYVLSQPYIDRIIIGIDNNQHLLQIMSNLFSDRLLNYEILAGKDVRLIQPSNWILN